MKAQDYIVILKSVFEKEFPITSNIMMSKLEVKPLHPIIQQARADAFDAGTYLVKPEDIKKIKQKHLEKEIDL